MWNRSIRFLKKETGIQDKDGFYQPGGRFSESIPASFTDATRNDEILAAQKGYTADQNIEIMRCNYSGECCLMDESDGTLYDIKRTYQGEKSMHLILTCERRQNGTV